MKKELFRCIAFIGKSLLWSLSLYVLVMTVSNWDDIRNAAHESNNATIQNAEPQSNLNQNAGIAQHSSTIKNILMLVKTICGVASMGK